MPKFQLGDHVVFHRLGYTHHGIVVGDSEVVHYTGEASKGTVKLTKLTSKDRTSAFDYDSWVSKFLLASANARHQKYDDDRDIYDLNRLEQSDILSRALSQVGENWYSILGNNCEHFAHWVTLDLPLSVQSSFSSFVISDLFGDWVKGISKNNVLGWFAQNVLEDFLTERDDLQDILDDRTEKWETYLSGEYTPDGILSWKEYKRRYKIN